MKLLLATFLAMFLIPGIAKSQVSCFGYGSGIVSCDGPRGNTTIVPFSGEWRKRTNTTPQVLNLISGSRAQVDCHLSLSVAFTHTRRG
jgi:hypothetical protein